VLSPDAIGPGYYWSIWADDEIRLLRVTERRGDVVAYEYLAGAHRYQTTDRVGIFLCYVDRAATEEDWLCAILTK
jgi:hypothetical protein